MNGQGLTRLATAKNQQLVVFDVGHVGPSLPFTPLVIELATFRYHLSGS
jgi:hypothetical protein